MTLESKYLTIAGFEQGSFTWSFPPGGRLTFREVLFELVEAVPPHLAVGLEPAVKLDERFGSDAVETKLAVRADRDQPCLPQDPQVLRDGRLADREALHKGVDRPSGRMVT